MKEGCNLTPFLLQVGLSVSLTHRLGQLPYPGPLPEHQRKRPQLKEPFFLFFSSFFPLLLSPTFFSLVAVSDKVGLCACFPHHAVFPNYTNLYFSPFHTQKYTFSLLSCDQLSKNKTEKTLITLFSKAAQVCDNRWVETLKQAKSSISGLNTCWLGLRLHRSPRTADADDPQQAEGSRGAAHRPDDAPWMWWGKAGGGGC